MNQWTLLVGSLPIVFAISAGSLHGLPLDSLQREELFLTAAQSVFAIAVLVSRSISVKRSVALFGLFIFQFVLGGILPEDIREFERIAVGMLYLVLAAVILFQQRRYLRAARPRRSGRPGRRAVPRRSGEPRPGRADRAVDLARLGAS